MLREQLGEVLVLPSHWACTEHMQVHTSPAVPGHRLPGAQPWLRSILTLGCQVTQKSVFDLTRREARPCFFSQVTPTASGFSPDFLALRLAPREQIVADIETVLIPQAPSHPDTPAKGSGQLVTVIHSALQVHASQL